MNYKDLTNEFLDELSDREILILSEEAYKKQQNGDETAGSFDDYVFDIIKDKGKNKAWIKIYGTGKEKQSFEYIRKITLNEQIPNNNID